MINQSALSNQATLFTPRLRLEQLHGRHFAQVWEYLHDPESMRLTGTHASFTPGQIRGYLESRLGLDDRADWAVIRQSDDQYLGEVVLNDLDADNRSANFRIGLAGEDVLGRGYGTEATRAVTDYGLDVVGLHRIALEGVRLVFLKSGTICLTAERHWRGSEIPPAYCSNAPNRVPVGETWKTNRSSVRSPTSSVKGQNLWQNQSV